jgi:aquaporin Z
VAVLSGSGFAPLAIGGALMVAIYAGGHISGAHFNPAVTVAVFMRGKCDAKDVVPYWVAQLAAAVVAALLVGMLFDSPAAPATREMLPSAIVEILWTFLLAWVILNVATAKSTEGNSFYGLAIGGTVMAGAASVGSISGGAFNPAVGLAVFMMGLESIGQFGLYVVCNVIGGALAAIAFKATVEDQS